VGNRRQRITAFVLGCFAVAGLAASNAHARGDPAEDTLTVVQEGGTPHDIMHVIELPFAAQSPEAERAPQDIGGPMADEVRSQEVLPVILDDVRRERGREVWETGRPDSPERR
jgi:hypothetical protein